MTALVSSVQDRGTAVIVIGSPPMRQSSFDMSKLGRNDITMAKCLGSKKVLI